jgi:hypothetical protein
VQATSAFITIFTLVMLVSAAATPLAVALFAMTSMHEVHASVLSEPLYLACMSLVLAAMVYAPDRALRAGIPAAVGVMTRYAGASLVGAVALWALVQPGTWMQRVRRAALALLSAVVLQGIWVIRTRAAASAGAEEIRKFAVYGNLRPTLAQGGATLAAWIVPDPLASTEPIAHRGGIAMTAGLVLVVLMSIGTWRAFRATRTSDESARLTWRLITASALLLVSYLGIVGVSRLLADPDIPLDERILAPALVLATTLAAAALALWWRGTRLVITRIAVCGALLGWWFAALSATYGEARYALEWGSDFAGEQWRHSELLDWARHDRGTLYSNWPAAVYFHLHRPARELPKDTDAATLAAFADTVRVRGGRVLLFDVAAVEFAPTALLMKTPGLRTVARLGDGVVLSSPP